MAKKDKPGDGTHGKGEKGIMYGAGCLTRLDPVSRPSTFHSFLELRSILRQVQA
ncbi:lariocidin/triculamin family lasso peptide core domain [Limnospira fusiformis]|uniref:lariocidin/triculamin family lasso peptide core domain n=1 Tax=Limnospira fusiformis TaxID=54297 RepID=UPI003F693051